MPGFGVKRGTGVCLAAAVGLVLFGAAAVSGQGGRAAQAAPAAQPKMIASLRTDDAPLRGRADATLVLIEFSDFECPFCGVFARTIMPDIERAYIATGQVQFAFRHFPLKSKHPEAFRASEAAECARRQDKFWAIHDRLFANQQALQADKLLGYARAAGVNEAAFQLCMNGQATARINADVQDGARAGLSGTPTFFVGTRQPDGQVKVISQLSGLPTFPQFKAILDKTIAQVKERR